MNASTKHIILTGATGYIGRRLLKIALLSDCQVTILSRHPIVFSDKTRVRWFAWSLAEPPPEEAFSSDYIFIPPSAIIHLAHAWHAGDERQSDNKTIEPNLSGLQLLLKAARNHQVRRFIFASSMAAREDAPNLYGRTKWKLEQLLREPDEISARIGLVYGGPQAGLWQTLCTIVKMSPMLPMVESGRPNQPIHVDDASAGLIKLATTQKSDRPVYRLADPVPVPFGRILQLIAKQTFDRPLLIIPISSGFIMTALDLLEYLPFIPKINRERLLGLSGILTSETQDDLEALGLRIRPFVESLSLEHPQRRRLLLREGKVLLHYLIGEPPPGSAIRSYVQGVIAYGDSRPVRLPFAANYWPPLLRFWEPLPRQETRKEKAGRDTLDDRINIALRVAETTAAGGSHMYDYEGRSKYGAVIELTYTLAVEMLLFPFRIVLGWRYR